VNGTGLRHIQDKGFALPRSIITITPRYNEGFFIPQTYRLGGNSKRFREAEKNRFSNSLLQILGVMVSNPCPKQNIIA